jgi:histone H3
MEEKTNNNNENKELDVINPNNVENKEIDEPQKNKRKRTRFFESYISKTLKTISTDQGITLNAKQQLNSCLCIIARELSNKAIYLTNVSNKKTMSEKEISNATKLMFSSELFQEANLQAEKALKKYDGEDDNKHSSRQEKAGILFPPSITEKFLRNFGISKIMITKNTPIYLASVLELIAFKILNNATEINRANNRVRITIRDLELTVRKNKHLDSLFSVCNLFFIGGGVVPQIHESLLSKKPRKKRKNGKEENIESKKTHRFRPGTVSLREIKKFQKASNCLTFAKFPFERYVRNIINSYNDGMKISKEVFTVLQYYIEQFIVDFLRDSNLAAIHSGRVKLMTTDINFICNLRKYDYKQDIKEDSDLKNEDL